MLNSKIFLMVTIAMIVTVSAVEVQAQRFANRPTEMVCGTPQSMPSRWISEFRDRFGLVPTQICLSEEVLARTLSMSREVKVFGTDYSPGDNATVFLQLLNDGQPIDNQSCRLSVFDTINTSLFLLDDYPMVNQVDENGNRHGLYIAQFTAPTQTGVYPLMANCTQPTTAINRIAQSFLLTNGTEASGSYVNTWTINENYHFVSETSSNPRSAFFIYNFTEITGNLSSLYKISVSMKYSLVDASNPNNPANENWVLQLENSTGDCENVTLIEPRDQNTPKLFTASVTTGDLSRFIRQGNITVCFQDTNKVDTNRDQLRTDYLSVDVTFLEASPPQEIRGGGEINVRNTLFYTLQQIARAVWEFFWRAGSVE